MSIAAIILAGGRGTRAYCTDKAKQYQNLGGKTVLYHAVKPFITMGQIQPILVAIPSTDISLCQEALAELADKVTLVPGGGTRQQSAFSALGYLENYNPNFVYIHDAARPLINVELLIKLKNSATNKQGAILALPLSDTLKQQTEEGFIAKTLNREGLFCAQTPQYFPFQKILELHKKAAQSKQNFTDDAALAEHYGMAVKLVIHTENNLKITWPEDFTIAESILKKKQATLTEKEFMNNHFYYPDIRTGNGYDIHSFVDIEANETGGITLCGIKIPYPKKLNGHSDSDVALHALTDALLATIGAGDIGTHFPPSDQKWKNANSALFLKFAYDAIKEKEAKIANVDITIIAEQPKIMPYRPAMVENLAKLLTLSPERVSIKATTNERLDAIGRGEGVAAIATASVIFPNSVLT